MSDISAQKVQMSSLFSEVKGFFIPEFQRDYTWTEEAVERLFDTLEGAFKTGLRQEYLAFLGAILAIDDRDELSERYGLTRMESPETVYALIDGQQRVTTLLLLLVELLRTVESLQGQLNGTFLQDTDIDAELRRQKGRLRQVLFTKNHFHEAGNLNDGVLQYLPKVIWSRLGDRWSLKGPGIYKSEVADYLLQFANGSSAYPSKDSALAGICGALRGQIQLFLNSEKYIEALVSHKEVQKRMLGKELDESIVRIAATGGADEKKLMQEATLLIGFVGFLLDSTQFVLITVNNETLAFDIFDVLNSTGDPLTSLETFKPLVIRRVGDHFPNSREKDCFDSFAQYLENHEREKRQMLTHQFVIALALFENGVQLSENTNEQRRYLRDHFELLQKEGAMEESAFVASIQSLVEFYTDIWEEDIDSIPGGIDDEAKICLDVLRTQKHTITVPVLARYYAEYVSGSASTPNYRLFGDIVKTVTSFSLLWRLLNQGGTAGIDDKYRNLMSERHSRRIGFLDLDGLRAELRRQLDNRTPKGHFDRQFFVEQVSKAQYSKARSNTWLKLLLVTALHDSIPDPAVPGLDMEGQKGCNETLVFRRWREIDQLTIEHITPQRPNDPHKWEKELFFPEHREVIGNLTLLPKQSNILAGNHDWSVKRKLYAVLGENNQTQRLSEMEALETSEGIKVTAKTRKLIKNTRLIGYLQGIARAPDWTHSLVKQRSKRLAELAWRNISPWLGY